MPRYRPVVKNGALSRFDLEGDKALQEKDLRGAAGKQLADNRKAVRKRRPKINFS